MLVYSKYNININMRRLTYAALAYLPFFIIFWFLIFPSNEVNLRLSIVDTLHGYNGNRETPTETKQENVVKSLGKTNVARQKTNMSHSRKFFSLRTCFHRT